MNCKRDGATSSTTLHLGYKAEENPRQVDLQLKMLEDVLDGVDLNVANVSEALDGVLRSSTPEPPNLPETKDDEELVRLARRIRNLRTQASAANNQLEDILRRLEL